MDEFLYMQTDIFDESTSNFLAEFSARRQRQDASDNDITTEVDRYLADSSSDLQSLHKYTHIRNVYISLNTRLPASAAVERLFSLRLGGRVFAPCTPV